MKARTFVNFTTEDFVGRWDGEDYNFKPGQTGLYPEGQVKTFARQLAVQECNNDEKGDDFLNGLDAYIAKAMPDGGVEVEGKASKVESEVINFSDMKVAELKEIAEEKGVDTKGKKKADLVSDLEEFEGADE